MNPTLEFEDLDNMVIYERLSERRSGIEKRAGELVKNKDLYQAAEILEKTQSLEDTKFIGEFG